MATSGRDPAAMSDDSARSPISADDVAISLAIRQDLGREHDTAVVAEFLDRVGPAIDARVEAKLTGVRTGRDGCRDNASSGLAFVSLGVGIPISGIALGATDGGAQSLIALAIAWAGIAAVNVVHSRRG